MPELHRWQIISNGRAEFACGYLYNDPRIENGTFIRTARLTRRDGCVISTALKSYKLIGDNV